ncbi:hypothetical protein AKJ43_03035 [candidate division MSBL1 archaeon SCGC-AAA261D19]|uniref:DNA polymerase II large subunit DP2 central domain-containing protein n=1 Tax=candidate division MSBL1 archaeon SCGC-AAA261D19 TaxID=1698273 RepID=A0A133V5Y5_9EURY|nr:hypothetical protein AKJ43_03035 [candidate division MSBL1 archaeon SCGC-AAA261D19]
MKKLLEMLEVPHKKRKGAEGWTIVIEEHAHALCATLCGVEGGSLKFAPPLDGFDSAMELVNQLAPFPVREKAPTRIGARMGRPEKAKPREMSPPVSVLYRKRKRKRKKKRKKRDEPTSERPLPHGQLRRT